MRIALTAAGALMLMACTTAVPPEGEGQRPEEATDRAPAPGGEGACNVGAIRDIVGRSRSEAVGADAMRRSGARTLRWLEPDSAYTMDFREDRLNIEVDARGRITRLRCG